jgi:hypothetical protein
MTNIYLTNQEVKDLLIDSTIIDIKISSLFGSLKSLIFKKNEELFVLLEDALIEYNENSGYKITTRYKKLDISGELK